MACVGGDAGGVLGGGGDGDGGGGLGDGGGGDGDGGGSEGDGGSGLDNSLDWKELTCLTAWSGVYWTKDDAVVKSTGSHCGGQATSRFAVEGRALERRWPIAGGSPRISQHSLVSQALETVESASRVTSVTVDLELLLW